MSNRILLHISTHSFVDLITNSSSELFVCNTEKTVDAVTELLKMLLRHHDEITGTTHKFEDVFSTPTICQYTFDWYDIPQNLRDEYEKHHEYSCFGRSQRYGIVVDRLKNEEQVILQASERNLNQTLGLYEKDLEERDREEYDRRWAKSREMRDELWTPFGAKVLKSELDLFIEFLRQNGFSTQQVDIAKAECAFAVQNHINEKHGQYPRMIEFSPEIQPAFEFFHHLESWGITTKKGDIMVLSISDNTIPYEMMETISSYLNADRYHLG